MEHIFGFFKPKTTSWEKIKIVVIDKDFVEWRSLQHCFPQAKFFLCQFHATTYWRKLLRRQLFDLRIAQRERLQSMFMQMLKR
ncbi:hypothetical protein JG688_00011045 [Phytophthora aleatoria]|uniref:ZSWIM1/3 RNaseH-like domain-containing protein n=1 Tax=Phytophthora aleatoria TaxID=2496075 RepID=A0A8J5IVA1_9STRA|nr:hypothetical protein JG688_00011045 [Phytophthora aleatoria]